MHKYDTNSTDDMSIANESAYSSYYTRPMIEGLRSHLQRKLQDEHDVQTLLRIESALSKAGEDTYAERYGKMKEYVFSHFDTDFAEEMMRRNFLINQPQPCNDTEFDDIDQMFEDAEASGECSEEEIESLFMV